MVRAATDVVHDRLVPVRDQPTKLPILTFHQVDVAEDAVADLRRLIEVANPVSLDRVLEANAGGDPLPKNAVLVTIDDGHHTVLEVAPAFAELGVPAICFVVTSVIDTCTPFWWNEVVELADRGARSSATPDLSGMDLVNRLKRVPDQERRAVLAELRTQVGTPVEMRQMTSAELRWLVNLGIDIGGHSVSHPLLNRCTDAVLAHEVTACRTQLTEILGATPRSFAYPGGGLDDRVVAATKAAGWEVAFSWDHAVSAFPFTDLHRISRVKAGLGSGRSRLALLATGRHRSLRSLSAS